MTNWISKQPSSGVAGSHEVAVTVPAYKGRVPRTGSVTGSAGNDTDVLVVNQTGEDIIEFAAGLLDEEISQLTIPSAVQTSLVYVRTNLKNMTFNSGGLVLPEGQHATVIQGSTVLTQSYSFGSDFQGDPGANDILACVIMIRPSSENMGRQVVGYRTSAVGENDADDEVVAFLSVIQEGHAEFITFDESIFEASYSDSRIVVTGVSNSPQITFSLKWDDKSWCEFEGSVYEVNGGYVENGAAIIPDIGLTGSYEFEIDIRIPYPNTNDRPREAELTATGISASSNATLFQYANNRT